ncbi:hypothetical protein BaRGS_00030243 [Batillaria attramentaria]|uniref:Uncharacterized protein n=1 Tax=Batillaria attramentaria TaxID=370345 RepID=A0ABD0JUX4_9CAEN
MCVHGELSGRELTSVGIAWIASLNIRLRLGGLCWFESGGFRYALTSTAVVRLCGGDVQLEVTRGGMMCFAGSQGAGCGGVLQKALYAVISAIHTVHHLGVGVVPLSVWFIGHAVRIVKIMPAVYRSVVVLYQSPLVIQSL